MTDEIEVWLADDAGSTSRVGRLRPSFSGGRALASTSFSYQADYLESPHAFAISPDLPLTAARQLTPESHTLFGAFSDAAPDDWGQKIIEANLARRRSDDARVPREVGAFDYLVGVSDHTRAGALRLRDSAGSWLTIDEGVANLHDLDRIVAAARRYESDEATDEDMDYLGDVATSPGGARPKANIVTPEGRLAIAKLPHSKDGPIDVERWEALALEIAERSGIRTPPRAHYAAGQEKSVLVVERFDRTDAGGRLPYISGATALQIGVHEERSVTYEEFADVVAELCGEPAAELRELFTRVALFVLIDNIDDHWRNHGFLRVKGSWQFSPVFDVNPSRRGGSARTRAISRVDDPRRRDIRNLAAIAATFGLARSDAAEAIGRVAESVADWRSIADDLEIPNAQQELMAGAFRTDQLAYARAFAESVPRRVAPPVGKAAALLRLEAILGGSYPLGRGSSIPSQLFTDAAERVGISSVGPMPERAERVVTAAGLTWDSAFDSRLTPSGGGSTVTLAGLERLIRALEILIPGNHGDL